MAKKRKKKKQKEITIQTIHDDRTGGQIALSGFSYQLLYSCYISLEYLDSEEKYVTFEGIEDVDLYNSKISDNKEIHHVQLKYSNVRQDASFYDSILKNFLEIYLASDKDNKRFYKLVYDANISKGNLSKLIENKIDTNTEQHWMQKIDSIKLKQPDWNWDNFNFNAFIKQLQFEKISRKSIELKTKKIIIDRFEIDNDNEMLFINSLFYNVFHKAQNREKLHYIGILQIIQNVKDNISKGYKNPSYQWISKIDFDSLESEKGNDHYFEGKKASPTDIVNNLPIRRLNLEETIINSIRENKITVIKSSSGQGKTTLAWQVTYNLRNEFVIYKLNWLKDSREINNIIEYFNSRLKLGKKIIIILDNLDEELKEWNNFARRCTEKLVFNYSILITTREDDWYAYSGDQSNLSKLKIIDLYMNSEQAKMIYENLKKKNKVHSSITNWQNSWEKVKDKKLLIEYIYLLTHGEMLSERLTYQLKCISNSKNSSITLEILRQIAFSDTIGVRLSTNKLIQKFIEVYPDQVDFDSILKSIKDEYYITIDKDSKYIEGLHPVRSAHIVEILHEFHPISKTMANILKIVDLQYVGKVFSQLPLFIQKDSDEFYSNLANSIIDKPYKFIFDSIKGIFSGSICKYYNDNVDILNDADIHGGLSLLLTEINPWNNEQYGVEVKTLREMNRIMPDNKNINYLLNLSNNIEKFNFKKSDFYIYSYYIYINLKKISLKRDVSSFAFLVQWLTRVDKKFNLIETLDINEIWGQKEDWDFHELGLMFYNYYSLSEKPYSEFINKTKAKILSFLRVCTDTIELYEDNDEIHIRYIPTQEGNNNLNDESVNRINAICRYLPIYKTYNAIAIKPQIDLFSSFSSIDNSRKAMPLRDVVIAFNSDLNQLWNNSILSRYEFSSVFDWQNYWFELREKVLQFVKLNIELLEKILKHQHIAQSKLENIDTLTKYISNNLIREKPYPYEKRPFEENSVSGDYSNRMKNGFFSKIQNYINQYISIIQRKTENNSANLAIINLKDSKNKLKDMQDCFKEVGNKSTYYFDVSELGKDEILWIDRLIILNEYYISNKPQKGEFNRQTALKWYNEKNSKLMDSIYEVIDNASNNSSLDFLRPKTLLNDVNLTTIPLGVFNLDLTDQAELTSLLRNLIPFSNINFNFLLLIFINKQFEAAQMGLRINSELINKLNSSLSDGEELAEEDVITPLPIEITDEHLLCFQKSIEIVKTQSIILENIDTILLLLWEYSKYSNLISNVDGEEKNYFLGKMLIIKKESELLLGKISKDFKERLTVLKDEIFYDNIIFSDSDLNNWFNELISYSNKVEIE